MPNESAVQAEIERLRQEINDVREELTRLKSKRSIDDLAIGDRYYVVKSSGECEELRYANDDVDRMTIERHRAFMTLREAEIFRDASQAMADLIFLQSKRMVSDE